MWNCSNTMFERYQAFVNVWYNDGDVLDGGERNFDISGGPWWLA